MSVRSDSYENLYRNLSVYLEHIKSDEFYATGFTDEEKKEVALWMEIYEQLTVEDVEAITENLDYSNISIELVEKTKQVELPEFWEIEAKEQDPNARLSSSVASLAFANFRRSLQELISKFDNLQEISNGTNTIMSFYKNGSWATRQGELVFVPGTPEPEDEQLFADLDRITEELYNAHENWCQAVYRILKGLSYRSVYGQFIIEREVQLFSPERIELDTNLLAQIDYNQSVTIGCFEVLQRNMHLLSQEELDEQDVFSLIGMLRTELLNNENAFRDAYVHPSYSYLIPEWQIDATRFLHEKIYEISTNKYEYLSADAKEIFDEIYAISERLNRIYDDKNIEYSKILISPTGEPEYGVFVSLLPLISGRVPDWEEIEVNQDWYLGLINQRSSLMHEMLSNFSNLTSLMAKRTQKVYEFANLHSHYEYAKEEHFEEENVVFNKNEFVARSESTLDKFFGIIGFILTLTSGNASMQDILASAMKNVFEYLPSEDLKNMAFDKNIILLSQDSYLGMRYSIDSLEANFPEEITDKDFRKACATYKEKCEEYLGYFKYQIVDYEGNIFFGAVDIDDYGRVKWDIYKENITEPYDILSAVSAARVLALNAYMEVIQSAERYNQKMEEEEYRRQQQEEQGRYQSNQSSYNPNTVVEYSQYEILEVGIDEYGNEYEYAVAYEEPNDY